MTDNGYVIAYRRAWCHPIFRDLLDAAVWSYLYQNAAWKDCRAFENGTRIELKRGQIFVSLRSLADGFCCAEPRIRRLINALHNDAMIETLATHRGTIITICNYDEYQRQGDSSDALKGTQSTDARRTGDAPSIKKKEIKEGNKINSTAFPQPPEWLDPILWGAFKDMRKGIKKPLTPKAEELLLKKLDDLRVKGHDPTERVEYSIMNNYPSIYEPRGQANENTRRNHGGGNGSQHQQGGAYTPGPAYDSRDPATRARNKGEEIIAMRRAARESGLAGPTDPGLSPGAG